MELDFYKIQISDNDFIIANYLYRQVPKTEKLSIIARRLCKLHTGIGANGLVVLSPGDDKVITLRLFLPDGRESGLLNDALLCAGRFCFDFGLASDGIIEFLAVDKNRVLNVIDSETFRISLGNPLFSEAGKELVERPDSEYTMQLHSGKTDIVVTPVYLHADGLVFFPDDMSRQKMKTLSKDIRRTLRDRPHVQPVFPQIYSREELRVFTWFDSRPVDFSSAAGIAAVASVIDGFCDRDPLVRINNQDFFVQWNETDNEIYITGKPEYVFSGTYHLEKVLN